MKKRNIFATTLIVISMVSCSGTKFMNRKYTAGIFKPLHKNIKHHNTPKTDSTKLYATTALNLKESFKINAPAQTEKEIIEQKTESIIKTDVKKLYVLRKKTETSFTINYSYKNKSSCGYKEDTIGDNIEDNIALKEAKNMLILFAIFWAFPLIGILCAIFAKIKLKKAQELNPNYNFSSLKIIYNLILILKIALTVACLFTVIYVFTLFSNFTTGFYLNF